MRKTSSVFGIAALAKFFFDNGRREDGVRMATQAGQECGKRLIAGDTKAQMPSSLMRSEPLCFAFLDGFMEAGTKARLTTSAV